MVCVTVFRLGRDSASSTPTQGHKKSQYSTYSQFSKTVYIGSSGGKNKKCVSFTDMECPSNAGDKGIKVNQDYKNANDRFKITSTSKKVCAKRVDNGGGWGQKLAITCAFKNIPKYQATAMTTAPGHLCVNRGSNGGKDKRYSKMIGPKKYAECLKWVQNTPTCGNHFNYGWGQGYCDCVPKGQDVCKFYTQSPKVKGLKSSKGWKVTKGFPKCTIDISSGVACVVSNNYPKKYSREEVCEISMAKDVSRLNLDMKSEKYFDFINIDGKQYHGTLKAKVDIKSKKLKWSSDFYEGGSWKICKARKKNMNVDLKKR